MKRWIALIALCPMVLLAQGTDPQAGEALYRSKCITCHGPDALGIKSQEGPRLRGQYDWYLLSSLKKFVQGERSNPKMMPYLQGLSEQDFKNIASYLSQLK